MSKYKGEGDMVKLVEEWGVILDATEAVTVIQNDTMSGIASITFHADELEIVMGDA